MRIEYSATTDVGKVRKENQDSFGVMEVKNFFIVCDGMGGGAAGDFASQCAVSIVLKALECLRADEVTALTGDLPVEIKEEFLRPIAALRLANRALYNYAQKYPRLAGMGTTAVAVLVDLAAHRLHIYHVGDSRLYRLRHGMLELLTKDHSKVNELIDQGKMKEDEVKTAEIQSMITRALGTAAKVKVDYRSVELLTDDAFVLCTDGLNGEIDDKTIRDVMIRNQGNIADLSAQLIAHANNAGGRDNTTVLGLRAAGDYNAAVTYPIAVQNVVTIKEETDKETDVEDKKLKTLLARAKIKLPKAAKDKNLLSNPLVLGLLLSVVIAGFAFFPKKVMTEKADTKLTDLSGTLAGIQLDVRVPVEAQLSAFKKAEDSIQRLQIIQDWLKNRESATMPLENVAVSIDGNGKNQFRGTTGKTTMNIALPAGACRIRVVYRNYCIITQRMDLVNEIESSVEPGSVYKPIVVIMIPANK